MLMPYTVDVPMERPPFANWLLIVVTTIISMLIISGNWPREAPSQDAPRKGPRNKEIEAFERRLTIEFGPPPLALKPHDFSITQLFTHLFVHADIFHLIGNMIFLFCFGNAVNAKLGQGVFLGAYFLFGAVAGLAWLLLGSGAPLVGASGAIMGIVGIFLVLFPRNDVNIFYWFGGAFAGSFRLAAIWLILFYLLCDLLGTAFNAGGVAYICHLTGALGGIGLAIGLLRSGLAAPTDYEENLLQYLGWQPKMDRYKDPERKRKLRERR
jgi:membrane associated rhomboid family serine protease